VQGRGSPRWDFNVASDLNYAQASADTAAGFLLLLGGLVLQALAITVHRPALWPFLLAVLLAGIGALALMWYWRRDRARSVVRLRLAEQIADEASPDQWGSLVQSYSAELAELGRPPRAGESAWQHLDRELGAGLWLPAAEADAIRAAADSTLQITDRATLGAVWLPWYVDRDDPSRVIKTMERDRARQLRVRDLSENEGIRQALLADEYEDRRFGRWNHVGRIEQKLVGWRRARSLGQGPVPALRTADGPVLQDGCHRACAMYEHGTERLRLTLTLTDPPPDHPDDSPEARAAANGVEPAP
jgi:hypothetical protein